MLNDTLTTVLVQFYNKNKNKSNIDTEKKFYLKSPDIN